MYETLNTIFLQGEIVTEPKITYTRDEESFYEFDMKIERESKKYDILKIMVSERVYEKVAGEKFITVLGEIRTRNYKDNPESEKSHLAVYVFAKDCQLNSNHKYANEVHLNGFICKTPIYRETPFSREICDLLIAVNRQNKKRSDYIPSITWGRNASFTGMLPIGTAISVTGRLQSREYQKTNGNETTIRTAYELSISAVSKLEE